MDLDAARERMRGLGFDLVGVEPGFADPETRELLQMDCAFMPRRGAG